MEVVECIFCRCIDIHRLEERVCNFGYYSRCADIISCRIRQNILEKGVLIAFSTSAADTDNHEVELNINIQYDVKTTYKFSAFVRAV